MMRLAFAVSLLSLLVLPSWAGAMIHLPSVLDGPANDILEVDGAAMAPDGSGGIVYRKALDGITHVYAVPFQNGEWGEPVEVDSEDGFGASQPAIAAGEGGRLLVVWVQPRNVSPGNLFEYALMSASLQPGASAFGKPIMIDPSVGEPDTGDISGVQPKLAMAPDGSAYVVYRVTADDCGSSNDEGNPERPKCRPGSTDKVVYVRVARFNYLTWSSLGAVNRAPQLAMRNPTSENAPVIGIDVNGNGIVAWQEPDAENVARIWVRRLFGVVKGNVLQASPQLIAGRPVISDAEAPALAVNSFGEARIAFRIKGASASVIPTAQLYENFLFSEFDPHGAVLQGAQMVSGASATDLGPPTVAIDRSGNHRLAWSQNDTVRQLTGSNQVVGASVQLGSAFPGPVLTTVNPVGGGTSVWSATSSNLPVVEAREDYAHGAYQVARLAGTVAGPVSGLALGGSGEGDALIAWMQGLPGDSEVVGNFVQAPPATFVVSVPTGWVRSRAAVVEWEPTTDAVSGVTYSVYVDGRPRLHGLSATYANLSSDVLGDGVHRVQVLAVDQAGQRTMSAISPLRVDVNPPIVKLASTDHRHGVRVTVRDKGSGVNVRATKVSFGDGHSVSGRVSIRHIYRHAGLYTITARVRDAVGNRATVRLRVRVR